MVFHWRLSDSKSPQVSRTLLSILAVFSNAIAWMTFTWPPTSKSSRLFNNPLVTVPKTPITTGIIVTFMFHCFFQYSSKVKILISLFRFFQFYFVVWRDSVMFWPFDPAKNAIQGDAPERSDTFYWQLWEEIAWVEIGWWNRTR